MWIPIITPKQEKTMYISPFCILHVIISNKLCNKIMLIVYNIAGFFTN